MKPLVKIAETRTPRGETWELWKRDGQYHLMLDGVPYSSEFSNGIDEAMAECGVSPVVRANQPVFLFAGIGLGFETAAAVRLVNREKARFFIAEPCRELVEWNRTVVADLHPGLWDDPRIVVESFSALEVARKNPSAFHAVFIKSLHERCAMTVNEAGDYFSSLKQGGLLLIALSRSDRRLEGTLRRAGFDVSFVSVPANKKGKQTRFHTLVLGRRGRYISTQAKM